MGLQDRDYVRDDYPSEFRLESMSLIVRLIVMNVIVFVIDLIFGDGQLKIAHELLAINANTLYQPWMWWQFLTYGFAHGSPSHLAFNMFALYIFGRELEYHMGKRELLWFYLTALVFSSVTSALLHAYQMRGIHGEEFVDRWGILGASGGVMAVIITFCLRFPMAPIIRFPFEVPAWMLGVFYVVGDLAGWMNPRLSFLEANIAYEAHLAGAAFAALYWFFNWRITSFIDNSWIAQLKRTWRNRRSSLRVHRPPRDAQSELEDQILEKVHSQGIGSLSAQEKKILEEYSRRLREEKL